MSIFDYQYKWNTKSDLYIVTTYLELCIVNLNVYKEILLKTK